VVHPPHATRRGCPAFRLPLAPIALRADSGPAAKVPLFSNSSSLNCRRHFTRLVYPRSSRHSYVRLELALAFGRVDGRRLPLYTGLENQISPSAGFSSLGEQHTKPHKVEPKRIQKWQQCGNNKRRSSLLTYCCRSMAFCWPKDLINVRPQIVSSVSGNSLRTKTHL
jgi:hypothetical protein